MPKPIREVPDVWKCICGEEFSAQVWHCAVCLHHWPMHRDACNNCYQARKLKALTAKRVSYEGSETQYLMERPL